MGGRWNLFSFQLHKVFCAMLLIHLLSDECLSLNLEGFALLEFRARVEVDPYGVFENWNPNDSTPCNWTGIRCIDDRRDPQRSSILDPGRWPGRDPLPLLLLDREEAEEEYDCFESIDKRILLSTMIYGGGRDAKMP